MPHEQFTSCIEACNTCADACDHCASSCLQMEDASKMSRCISLDIDCAALCRLAAGYMARGSALAAVVCQACSEVCDACAKECERHSLNHCNQCAEACRRCAEECRRLAGSSSKGMPKPMAKGETHAH